MNHSDGKIFVFSAPSGAGKTTIIKKVLKEFPQLVFSISATTRDKREDEIDGKDYFFLSEKDFEDKIKQNEFVEWEQFYDCYYGTMKSFVEKNIMSGKNVLMEVDVKGALSVKKMYPKSILIFITPPSIDELKHRLIVRNTETEEELHKRFQRMEMEMSYQEQFDYIVLNEDLEKAYISVKEILNKNISEGII